MAETREVDTRLGRQVVDLSKVIRFPRGIIGYEDHKEFTLLQIRPDAPFLVLQSMNDPTLGLLVADPYGFMPDYTVKVGDAEQKLLKMAKREELAVLVTVAVPPGKPEQTVLSLTGPILINQAEKIGLQAPQTDLKGPLKILLNTADLTPIQ